MEFIELSLLPQQILNDPFLNKGTAFTKEERDSLGLHGFLPYRLSTIEKQVSRRYADFCKKRTGVGKYAFLNALQNRNEILFYRLVQDHVEEMLPLIYTPTVGEVSLQFSSLFTKPRGLYISYPMRDQIEEIVNRIPKEEIQVVVATDGERILGLGDLGANGMPIAVGKLALYTLFGGIHPSKSLPILLDVGTNNQDLLQDEDYMGWVHPRITGKEYDDFIDRVIKAFKKRFPDILWQWEDFGKNNAYTLLDRYQDQLCSFNDDIQGTAAVVLAAIFSAVKKTNSSLKNQKIVIFGGGSAGIGIASQIVFAMKEEGVALETALKSIYIVDRFGLIHTGAKEVDKQQKKFERSSEEVKNWKAKDHHHITLAEVVHNVHPTMLIGVSAQTGAFTSEILSEMAKHTERPIVFPLSNPTSKAEAVPEVIYEATNGKAIVATGSPFPMVTYKGKDYLNSQCNNVYIFPGVGLGAIAVKAKKVTDKMFLEASKELAFHAPMLVLEESLLLFPHFNHLRDVSKKIAFRVAKVAQEEGHAKIISDKELMQRIESNMWKAEYPMYRRKSVH